MKSCIHLHIWFSDKTCCLFVCLLAALLFDKCCIHQHICFWDKVVWYKIWEIQFRKYENYSFVNLKCILKVGPCCSRKAAYIHRHICFYKIWEIHFRKYENYSFVNLNNLKCILKVGPCCSCIYTSPYLLLRQSGLIQNGVFALLDPYPSR